MRTFKFRYWDSEVGLMLYENDDYGSREETWASLWRSFIINLSYLDQGHLMQWTGLKDKNGKDIYEGDIINCYGICEVVFWNGRYCLKLCDVENKYNRSGYEDLYDNLKSISIVLGNIYENPNFLKNNHENIGIN
jgi:uncharacterized phage protein (TIGR01671 family)